jgi:flagellar biosynthetic protein FlhB
MADSNKTEKPTGRRLEKARNDGQFASSREVVAATQFLIFLALALGWFGGWLSGVKEMFRNALVGAFHARLDLATLPGILAEMIQHAFLPLAVLGGLTTIATLSVHLAVTKLGFSLSKLTPDFKRFNPVKKVQQLVKQGPSALLQAVAMLVLFSTTVYLIARQNAEIFLALPFASLDVGLPMVGASLKQLLWKAAAVFVVFGLVDLFRQRRRFMKDLRMSKQEVKDEAKDMEGNPLVRGKIKRLRRDLARRRMMKEVATATAVIVNPTHYAVALRYRFDSPSTPTVVAKGKNLIAARIRQLARENNVPLVENPPLAQALYKHVDVGREIPPHLYRAVAEVLAYLYRLMHTRPSSRRP